MKNKTISLLMSVFFAVAFSSCIKEDDFNFDKMELGYEGSWVANLLNRELSLADLNLDSTSSVTINGDDTLILRYNTTRIYSLSGDQLYGMNLDGSFDFVIPPAMPTVEQSIGVDLRMNDMIFDSIGMKSGYLNLNILTDPNCGNFKIRFKSDRVTFKDGKTLDTEMVVSSGKANMKINLQDVVIKMPDSNKFPLTISLSISGGGFLDLYPATFSYSLEVPKFSWVHGQMAQRDSLYEGAFSVSFFEENFHLKMKTLDPKLYLKVSNNIGIPLSLSINELKYNNISVLKNIPSTHLVNFPTVRGKTAESSYTFTFNKDVLYDNRNTNINYSFLGILSPDGINGNRYFITDSARYAIHAVLDVPLNVAIEKLTYYDTIEFNLNTGGTGSYSDLLESAEIRMKIDNKFPIGVNAQVYFMDDNYNIKDSLFTSSSILNAGKTTESNTKITHNKLDVLEKTKYLFVKVNLDENIAGKSAVFSIHQKLGIRLGAKANLKIKN